nr:hypothetical protein [Tanacetum cinerariifolium]
MGRVFKTRLRRWRVKLIGEISTEFAIINEYSVKVDKMKIELLFLEDQFQEDPPPEVPMADNRTMAKLLQAPTEGYEDAIIIPEITANNFELKHGRINLVQNKQFFRHDKEDPHAHIRYFNKITSMMRVPNDSLNSGAGGNFLDKMPQEFLKIIESKSKVRQSRAKAVVAKLGTSSSTPAISSEVAELKDLVRALLLDKKNQSSASTSSPTPASVKAVEPNCVTCGGTHSYQNFPATSGNVYRDNIQDAPMPNLKSSIPYPSRRDNERRRDQANEQIKKFYEVFKDMSFEISFTDALILMPKFASTLKALIGNKEKLRMDECLALADLGASINLMLFSIGIAKDVSFKVGVFHFPADFMVVDFEPDPRVPLILERYFLKTGRALINVHKGELTLRIRNEAITYNLDQTERYSAIYNQMTTNKIEVIKMACEEYSQEVLGFFDVTTSGNPTPHDDPIVSITSPTITLFRDSDFPLFEETDAFLGLEDDLNSLKINPFYYDPEGDILLLEAILNSKPLPPFPNHEQYPPSFKKELKVCEAKTVKSFVDEPP